MSHLGVLSTKQQEVAFAKILKKTYNQRCADCTQQSPTWASLDFGVFVCMNCSGAHRNLGQNNTRVRSTQLDCWTQENIDLMEALGNDLNDYWENRLPPRTKITPEATLEQIIAYVHNKYIKRNWVKQGAADPKTRYLQCLMNGVPFRIEEKPPQKPKNPNTFFSENGSQLQNKDFTKGFNTVSNNVNKNTNWGWDNAQNTRKERQFSVDKCTKDFNLLSPEKTPQDNNDWASFHKPDQRPDPNQFSTYNPGKSTQQPISFNFLEHHVQPTFTQQNKSPQIEQNLLNLNLDYNQHSQQQKKQEQQINSNLNQQQLQQQQQNDFSKNDHNILLFQKKQESFQQSINFSPSFTPQSTLIGQFNTQPQKQEYNSNLYNTQQNSVNQTNKTVNDNNQTQQFTTNLYGIQLNQQCQPNINNKNVNNFAQNQNQNYYSTMNTNTNTNMNTTNLHTNQNQLQTHSQPQSQYQQQLPQANQFQTYQPQRNVNQKPPLPKQQSQQQQQQKNQIDQKFLNNPFVQDMNDIMNLYNQVPTANNNNKYEALKNNPFL